MQGQDQYSFASQEQADNYYQHSRQTLKTNSGYEETFHQTGSNAGYGETFHQTGPNQGSVQHQDGMRYSYYQGQPYDEEDYNQAREGGTVADLSEYLAQKRQEDIDAGFINQHNKSFEQDEPHDVYPQMSDSVAQDADDFRG